MTDTATSFNPLEVARDLKAAGVEAGQADAIADAMRKAATADHVDLATKADLAATRADLAATRSDLAALRVEIRIIGALVLMIAAKLFGIFNAVANVLS